MVGGGEQEGSGAEPHRAGKRQQCTLPSSGALLLGSKVCPLSGVLRREAVKRKAPKARFKSVFVIEDSRERSWVPPDQLPIGQPLGGQGQGPPLSNLGKTQRENAAQGC